MLVFLSTISIWNLGMLIFGMVSSFVPQLVLKLILFFFFPSYVLKYSVTSTTNGVQIKGIGPTQKIFKT